METVLDTITAFADRAHGAQTRRYTPERYIVHPVRVMELCREYTTDEAVLAAALLHDVLEDTPVTRTQLTDFLLTVMAPGEAHRTVQLVEELTDVYVKPAYPHLNRKQRKKREADRLAKTSPDAQTIKYADIIDNGTEMVRHDPAFARLFLHEGKMALLKMAAGDSRLYQRALRTIDECLNSI
jgi:(p)ppGpp synthase/HD superfamily hydrolase